MGCHITTYKRIYNVTTYKRIYNVIPCNFIWANRTRRLSACGIRATLQMQGPSRFAALHAAAAAATSQRSHLHGHTHTQQPNTITPTPNLQQLSE